MVKTGLAEVYREKTPASFNITIFKQAEKEGSDPKYSSLLKR
jgi:hypothetical protein